MRVVSNMTTIVATLRYAQVDFDCDGDPVIRGQVYGDTLGRFADGQLLVIGPLLDEPEPCVFQTKAGLYKVEFDIPLPEGSAIN